MTSIDDRFAHLVDLHGRTFAARNLSAQTSRELGIRILRGITPPGATLPQEPELAKELGVSRTVVREAIKILSAKGFVLVRPRLGTRVRERWHWQILDRDVLEWQQAVSFDRVRLIQLTEMRRAVEPAAASLAALRRTAEEVEELRATLSHMEGEVEEPGEFAGADARFHFTVLKAAHNEFFDALESAIFTGVVASIHVTNRYPADNPHSLPFHLNVFSAIEAGDADGASRAMAVLLEDAERRLDAAFARGEVEAATAIGEEERTVR